jgi:pyridoxine kinase
MDHERTAGVFVTSPPLGPGSTGLLALDRTGATLYRTARHASVPNGVGDVLSALIARAFRRVGAGSSAGADRPEPRRGPPAHRRDRAALDGSDPIAAEPFAPLTGRAETG